MWDTDTFSQLHPLGPLRVLFIFNMNLSIPSGVDLRNLQWDVIFNQDHQGQEHLEFNQTQAKKNESNVRDTRSNPPRLWAVAYLG